MCDGKPLGRLVAVLGNNLAIFTLLNSVGWDACEHPLSEVKSGFLQRGLGLSGTGGMTLITIGSVPGEFSGTYVVGVK